MRPTGQMQRDRTTTGLAALLLIAALVFQSVLGAALQGRAAGPKLDLAAVLCITGAGGPAHDASRSAGDHATAADCLAFCLLAAAGAGSPPAMTAFSAVRNEAVGPAAPARTRPSFVLDAQSFLAAARAPPTLSA
jgi:hypothetical protein